MPRHELEFIADQNNPTDQELLLQLVYGLGANLSDPREEHSIFFVSHEKIPFPYIRRLMKLLITRCDLPVPPERADEWIEWQRNNQCWIVNEEDAQRAARLRELVTQ